MWPLPAALALAVAWMSGCVCPGGQLSCGGQCVDPRTSDGHCGACGVSCGAGQRCEDARCVRLPECGPRAATPITCDDDDVCNGRYECLDGFCQRIAPPLGCDDSLYCTVSRCEPSTGRCTHEPDDAYCDVGHRCDPDRGCVERCALEPCTVATQCGCASDQTCGPVGSAGACVPRGGTNEGNRCTRTEDCALGLVCTSLGTGDGDRCSRPCDDSAECDGDLCLVQLGYETVLGNGDRFGRCEQVCDPVDSRGCGTSQLCLLVGSGRLATLCVDQGSARTGQSCILDTDCARDNICVRYSDGEFCGELCHTSADCSFGRTCFDFTTPLTLRGERLGVCG